MTIEYALRVDITKTKSKKFIKTFIEKFNLQKYLFTFEISKIEKKPHIHAYYTVETLKKSTLADFMASQNLKGKYSNTEVKDKNKYKLYILKDLDILSSNLSEEEMDSLLEQTQDINADKGKKLCQKLFIHHQNRIEELDKPELLIEKREIIKSISNYYKINPKCTPPNASQWFQYVTYIILHNDEDTFIEMIANKLNL